MAREKRIPRLEASDIYPGLDVMSLTPAERICLVDEITRKAYELAGVPYPEKMRRDIVRVIRGSTRRKRRR